MTKLRLCDHAPACGAETDDCPACEPHECDVYEHPPGYRCPLIAKEVTCKDWTEDGDDDSK